jgi:hypothetical protein
MSSAAIFAGSPDARIAFGNRSPQAACVARRRTVCEALPHHPARGTGPFQGAFATCRIRCGPNTRL